MQFDIKVIPRNAMVCLFAYISEVIVVTTNMRPSMKFQPWLIVNTALCHHPTLKVC